MHRTTRLKVTEINQRFLCILCEGYLIDATTIVECLHSFCRTCIVRYLENNKYCPVCEVQVHKTKPLQSIRSDTTLQDVVYKLIPGLYQNEMQRRREFYSDHPEAAAKCSSEERGEGAEQRCFYSPKENISLTLEYFHGSEIIDAGSENSESKPDKDFLTRHLNCPAAMSVANLKKFLRMKFSIPSTYSIKILYADNLLSDEYTLMDIAYIYSWRRAGPMQFLYTFVHSKSTKRFIQTANEMPPLEPLPNEEDSNPASVDQSGTDVSTSENPPTSVQENTKMDIDDSPAKDTEPTDCLPSDKLDTVEVVVPPESTSEPMEVVEPEPPAPVPDATSPKESTAEFMPQHNVQVVPTPQSTVLATTNGIKLKLIHCPEPDSKTRSKKSTGRKGGRTRYKSAPVQNRFPRLAPYPPPHTSACLGASSIAPLSQLTVGKITPSVMTSLPPNLVTALVSNTANTLCNVTKNSTILPAAPFFSQSPLNVVTCNVTTQQISCNVTTHSNSFATRIPGPSSPVSSASTRMTPAVSNVPCSSYLRGMTPTHVIAIPPVNTSSLSPTVMNGSPITTRDSPVVNAVLKPATPQPNISSSPISTVQSSVPADSVATVVQTNVSNGSSNTPVSSASTAVSVSKDNAIPIVVQTSSLSPVTPVSKPEEHISEQPESLESPPSILKSALSDKSTSVKKPLLNDAPPETKIELNCNGVTKPHAEEPVMRSPEKKSTSAFEMSVKNSISAEFSDNDDLGCQPDLVVDEQKMDSSDNEDDTDAALRKKITAIAEKEDEADGTDDTEADSGRASDLSSQARSSCDDDIGSPMNVTPSSETMTVPSQLAMFPVPPAVTIATSAETNRNMKSNNINHVINNLHKHHEKKDPIGALDLSTCTKKPGEGTSRPKPVANPVLDIKHRQQTYLPAPNKPHTACMPSPKHPTALPVLMHGLSGHHNLPPQPPSVHHTLSSQSPAVHGKSPHLPVPHFHNTPMVFSSQNRTISSPSSLAGRSTPTYSNTAHALSASVPSAHQVLNPMLSGMMCMGSPVLASYPIRGGTPMPSRSSTPANHLKGVTPQPQNPYGKMSLAHLTKSTAGTGSRKSNSDSHHAKSLSTPNNRNSPMVSTSYTPGTQATYPKSSLTNMKLSPHHRSASPAPSPKPLVPPTNVSGASSHKSNQSSIPMYKKSSNSYKSYNPYKYKGGNFTVVNPDPNGNLHKLVIRNNDVRPNNHQSQKS